jgi:hypothetical protein
MTASRLYLVSDAAEIARRRARAGAGGLLEAWPDLYASGEFWVGESAKTLLDGPDDPLPARFWIEGSHVPVYYGPRLSDLDSLPAEESLRSRVLSAHAIAVAWITLDRFGERAQHAPASPRDPIFYLRRPSGRAAHLWRLFRTRGEARVYMTEYYGDDPEAREWASSIPAEDFDDLLSRHATPGEGRR